MFVLYLTGLSFLTLWQHSSYCIIYKFSTLIIFCFVFADNCLRRHGRGGQSLPDLRITDNHGDSGDSTDSLIDEAEDYVRRSIDSIVTRTDLSRLGKRRMIRRHSDPDPAKG